MALPATYYGELDAKNPVLARFRRETGSFLTLMKQVSSTTKRDHSSYAKGINLLMKIRKEYINRIPERFYQEHLLEVADILCEYKLYQLALWQGYGLSLLQLSSVQITDITDVDHFMACFFPEGFELEQGTFTIKTRAMFGCAICIFEEEKKHSILSQKGLSILLKALNFIRIMMQAFQQHEHLSWLIYNGSMSIYNICRYLMTMNCSEQALEYLLWASISLELSIPLMTPRYLPLIVALYCSVCQCYYDNQSELQAEDFAKRALEKINEMANLEEETECTNELTQKAYRAASVKLGVLVFKRTVFESRKPKTTLRTKNKSTLKEIPNAPWPRTPTEQMLLTQFGCTAGQFLAISEALWESHTRPLEIKLPDDPELLEIIIELLSAGMSILSGGTSSNTAEQKSDDHQSFCPNVLTTESTIVDLATEGENKIPIKSAVRFIKLLFKYKQPEAFSELTEEMLHTLSGVEGTPFRKAQRELTLLYSYSCLLYSQREGTREDKKDDRQKFFSAVSDELVCLVDTLHLCVFGPDPELQPNPDLVFDILVFLWKKLKNIMQSHYLEIQDSINDQQKLQCYDKLLWCLSVMCEVAIICEVANVDCIMVAEMIHVLGEHVERVLGRINQAERSVCGRSEDMKQSPFSLLKESNTNLLKKVCEVTKKGLDALSNGVSELIPHDHSAITDTAYIQKCKSPHPCSPSTAPGEEQNGTDENAVKVEEEKETKGKSITEGQQDKESKKLFVLAKDLHLRLDIIYHKASVKLLLLNEVKESDLLHRIKRNKLSKAHFMMQKASAEHSKGQPHESSKIRSLLEEALVLVEKAELEEMQTYMASVRNVNGKKHKTEQDVGEKAPPAPMLISRTDHSITFAPAEYDLKKRVSWYQLCGRTVQGANSKVRLGECSLPGTGNMVPVVSGECLLRVEGLQPNQMYVFAVAAYDNKWQLVGNSIGDTTLPVLACLPTPVLSTWAHLAQVAFETGQYAVAKRACRKLWSQYIDPDCSSNSKHNRFASIGLHKETLQHSSPHTCKMFLNSIFTETEINIQQGSLHWDTCGDRGPFIWEQEARLAETERMMLAMDLAIYLNDGGASLRVVVTCYRLLAPLIYHQIACDPVVQVLLKCFVVLEDNSSLMKQKWTGNSSEFLLHMISCITYYLSTALQTFRKYDTAAAVLDCGRTLVQEVFDAHFKFGKLIVQAGNDKAAAIAAAESQRKMNQLIKALHVKSIRFIESEEVLHKENEIALVTLEDPSVLYRLFPSRSLQDNFNNVIKLQRKKYFLEFASLLLRRTMEEGSPDQVLEWGLAIFQALSRRDEVLGLATKSAQEDSKSKEGESTTTRKKSEVPQQGTTTAEELRRKLRKKLPRSLLKNLKTLRELHIVEHLLFLMSFVVQRNKKRIHLRNLVADERAERSFLNYCMATAHLAKFYQGVQLINEGHLNERYSQLDICWFSLAHSGVIMRKYSLPSSENKVKLQKASGRKADMVTPKVERKRREAVRKVIQVPKRSTDEKDALFQNLQKDTQKRSSYVLLSSVENAALHFRRAMVLAHRGNHWTTLQYMCQSVWDQNHKLTAMVQNGALNKSFPSVITDELQAIFTPLLVLATDFMLDMLTKLQIWSLYDLDVTVEELESRLHFSLPYDDCFLVDLRWVRTLVLYTLEQLHFCGKWETLAHFALLYNSYTRERYALMIVPLLVHAQRNLLERISSFKGPAVPQPHHVKTENTTGKKITNRTYAGCQLLSVWNRPPAPKQTLNKKGAKKVPPKDPFSLKVSELPLAMSLVRVPLVVEETLSCFREALRKRSPSLPLLKHSRSLVVQLLACTQPCFAPQTPTCQTRGGTSRPASEVTFSPAVVTSPDLLPDDLLEEDFSSTNAIYSLPISLNSVPTVTAAYTNSIQKLQANGHDSLHILALHEIGNLHFYAGNISAAHSCWSKALDCIFQSSGVIQQCDGVNFESSFSQNIVKQAGIWGCLQGAVLAAKIAQFISTSDITKRTKRCRLSAHFFKCVLCCSMAHPLKDLQYSSHSIRDELFPGIDLFSEPHRLQVNTTVASLHFVCHWLFITGYYITLFPILAFYLYFVGPVCRDVQRTAEAKILKIRALTELCMFTEAIAEAIQFTQGADIFLPYGLHLTAANLQRVRTFCSNASLPDNVEAVEDLVNCDFTSEVCTLYGPTLCSKFNLARIQLILAITKSVRGSPVPDPEESCSTPESKEVQAKDMAQDEQERHETEGSSPKTERPKVVCFANEKTELSPERIKFILLEGASTLFSSATQQLSSLTCSEAEKLELVVEFNLLKANLCLQQENYALSFEAAVSALVLLQTSPVTVTPSPPGSKQDTKDRSVPDNLHRDMSKAVEARERTGALLWLRCRLTLVHCLTANIPAIATLFPGKNINEEIYQVIQQGLDECLQWGDKDIQALFMVEAAELEAQRNRIDKCMAMLKKTVNLLSGRTCMPPRSVLTLARATLLLSDLKKEQSTTLLRLTQKLLEKKLCLFDENIIWLDGNLSFSPPGPRNIYLPYLDMLNKITVRIDSVLNVGNMEGSAFVQSSHQSEHPSDNTEKDSQAVFSPRHES
ncbi:cilia- and flagella-associated protein 54 isoform X1 [Poecilia formosa]|uniref:cilia- and flagella-associated protein 54 isoform X1 n=1 Tax=Poecilia formosa TaxID=48698 RepID=UPI0007B91ECC|nr:PREDICTED: cilia- and flagella-associated protein 54 isoform X1 [Poecilia formosa]